MAAAEHDGRVMGSELRIIALGASPAAVSATVTLLEDLDARWSPFEAGSELAAVARGAGAPVPVSTATVLLVEAMCTAWAETAGRFDPTLLPALASLGGGWSRTQPIRQASLPVGPLRWGAAGEVVTDRRAGTVTVPPGVVLDASGIGKGMAADLAVAHLLANGATGCLVAIGGDLALGGTAPDPWGWTVVVERPGEPGTELARLAVGAGGVATSSTRSHRWRDGGTTQHPTVDPLTGRPSGTDVAAVTVIGRSGWWAEALATAALVSGAAGALDVLRHHGASGLVVDAGGQVLATPDVAEAIGLVPR